MNLRALLQTISMSAAILVVGCGQEQGTSVTEIFQGGTDLRNTPEAASVVQIVDRQNRHLCSGVIVGRHEVLTASHCLSFVKESEIKHELVIRSDIGQQDIAGFYKAAWAHKNNIPLSRHASDVVFDLAILVIQGAFERDVIAKLADTDPPRRRNRPIQLIGYGDNAQSVGRSYGAGTKRIGTNVFIGYWGMYDE